MAGETLDDRLRLAPLTQIFIK